MIRLIAAAIVALYPSVVTSETIQQMITRGNAEYMASLKAIPPGITPDIVKTFGRISKLDRSGKLIMLKIADGPHTGITNGNTVIVHYSVETMTELQRAFIIAHEFGHIVHGHLGQKIAAYEKYIPGDVTDKTLLIADRIVGPELRTLSHKVELEADSYALRTLVKLGWTRDQVVDMFLDMKVNSDTATHPSSAKRIRNLVTTQL